MQTLNLKRWFSSISILALTTLLISILLLLYGSDALRPYDSLIGLKSAILGDFESEAAWTILFQVRLPRIILALITGGALATAGAGFQAVLKNPLADPYVLGVSSGAALGVVIAIYMNLFLSLAGISSIICFAFIGAILTMYLVYKLGTINSKIPPHTMLLSGVMINAIIFAAILLIVSIAKSMNLYKIFFWLLGYLSSPDYSTLFISFIVAAIGACLVFYNAKSLNILTMDDESAASLGIDVEMTKKMILIGGALLVAASVSICGPISFIGILIPHTVRLIAGYDYRFILPLSMIAGGLFLAVADTVARTLLSPAEIPVGIITALTGGPFFLYLLRTRRLI